MRCNRLRGHAIRTRPQAAGVTSSLTIRRAEDLLELVGSRDFELIIAAVVRWLVRPPPQKQRRMAKAPSLQVVVLDLANPLDSQRLPRKILARAPAALGAGHADELSNALLR